MHQPRPTSLSSWPGKRIARVASLGRDREGSATLEFVLVFPVLLFLVLTLLQVTLLMVGNVFVHYAAFAATRSAVAQISADRRADGGEPRNAIVPSPESPKFNAIRSAACYAVMPVAGRSGDASVAADPFVDALRRYLSASGRPEPNWVDQLAGDRLRYAAQNTQVTILATSVDRNDDVVFTELSPGVMRRLGPLDAVTVRVEHRLFLSVPYVWKMFADGDLEAGGYADVTAQYTLNLEGVDPALPSEPALPRDDP